MPRFKVKGEAMVTSKVWDTSTKRKGIFATMEDEKVAKIFLPDDMKKFPAKGDMIDVTGLGFDPRLPDVIVDQGVRIKIKR
jgi:hypothetical protein